MTSIVAVLNKHAVAIAADSAVTMGNTHKVVNSANKIFTLSKYHPVAVMIYGNASFMDVPWDIIIKEYRKFLGEKSYLSIGEYRDNFIAFLHQKQFFCDTQTQHAFLNSMLDNFYNLCCKEIYKEKNITNVDLTSALIEGKLSSCLAINKTADKCPEFESYTFEEFLHSVEEDFKKYASDKKIDNYRLLSESYFYYLCATFSEINYTGLVFVGYGEDDIYPSLMSINVSSIVVDNHLKYHLGEGVEISEHGTAASIIPFAQIDVTQTIVRGINPGFQDIITNVITKSIKSFCNTITNIIDSRPENKDVSLSIKNLDLKEIDRLIVTEINKEMKMSYTDPLMGTVVALDKEDMANMARSFISLTSLVRRMQPAEETVGGPVDVAVISKGDGFIWINRKHYFKPEFNAQFFNNYFK
ncbi:MAG: hypothetical protein LKF06_00715 [Prevotella sp.]|jgi:hypothetical protein|nr:hypothetical protein [Prevotella sp.]